MQDRYSQIPLVIFAGTPGSGTKKQDMVDSEDQSFSKRGAFNGDDNPSLHSLKDAKLWSAMVMPQWQAVVSLPCLWTSESREPDPPCLSRSSPPGDLACLSRTKQSPRPHAHVWRLSHHGVQLDQKKGTQLPPLSTTLLAPDPEDAASTTLELDGFSCI